MSCNEVFHSLPLTPSGGWLTDRRCRLLAVALVLVGMALNIHFLWSASGLALTGDEAYYWDWSRQLDWSYYSKPPMIALLIRASCALFGDTMQAVRLPAVLLAAASQVVAWTMVRRLFGNCRIALAAVGMLCCMPLLIAGAVLMTIDSPLFLFWGMASLFAAIAIFQNRKWSWVGCGLALGLAMLTKYSAVIWWVGMLLFLLTQRDHRRQLKTPWPYVAGGIMLLALAPAVIWNARHGWVTVYHVWGDVGGSESDKTAGGIRSVLEFLGGQMALALPTIMALIIGGAVLTFRRSTESALRGRLLFLFLAGAPLWVLSGLPSIWTKAQGNWPAPAYFSLGILATVFAFTRRQEPRQWYLWRGVIWATPIIGVLVFIFAHSSEILYPVANRLNHTLSLSLKPVRLDVGRRGRGWQEMGREIGDYLAQMPPGTLIMCNEYQFAALAAFYTPGQPKTYRYATYLPFPERMSQYEIWPDRRLDNPELVGRDAIVVSGVFKELAEAFDEMTALQPVEIHIAGVKVRTIYLSYGRNFKGLHRTHTNYP